MPPALYIHAVFAPPPSPCTIVVHTHVCIFDYPQSDEDVQRQVSADADFARILQQQLVAESGGGEQVAAAAAAAAAGRSGVGRPVVSAVGVFVVVREHITDGSYNVCVRVCAGVRCGG